MALPTQLTADMHNVTNDMHDASLEEKQTTTQRAADAPPLNGRSHGNGAQQLLPPQEQQQQQRHEQSQHPSSLFAWQLPNLTLHGFTLPIRGAVPFGEDNDDSSSSNNNKFTSTCAVAAPAPAHNNADANEDDELEDAVVVDDQANHDNNASSSSSSSSTTATLPYSAARYRAMQAAAAFTRASSTREVQLHMAALPRHALTGAVDAELRRELLARGIQCSEAGWTIEFVDANALPRRGSGVPATVEGDERDVALFFDARKTRTEMQRNVVAALPPPPPTRPAIVPFDDDDDDADADADALADAFVRAAVHLGVDDADREREIGNLLARLPRRPDDGAVEPECRDALARRGMALVGPRGWAIVAYIADGEGGRREVEVKAPREALDRFWARQRSVGGGGGGGGYETRREARERRAEKLNVRQARLGADGDGMVAVMEMEGVQSGGSVSRGGGLSRAAAKRARKRARRLRAEEAGLQAEEAAAAGKRIEDDSMDVESAPPLVGRGAMRASKVRAEQARVAGLAMEAAKDEERKKDSPYSLRGWGKN